MGAAVAPLTSLNILTLSEYATGSHVIAYIIWTRARGLGLFLGSSSWPHRSVQLSFNTPPPQNMRQSRKSTQSTYWTLGCLDYSKGGSSSAHRSVSTSPPSLGKCDSLENPHNPHAFKALTRPRLRALLGEQQSLQRTPPAPQNMRQSRKSTQSKYWTLGCLKSS